MISRSTLTYGVLFVLLCGGSAAGVQYLQRAHAAALPAARAAHQSFVGDNGKPLVIKSAELWVPPSLEGKARRIVEAETGANGASKINRGLAKVVVCPWLTA